MLIVRAPAASATRTLSATNFGSARVASIGLNSTSSVWCRARVTAASAISNVKFDKVVVWDSGENGGGAQGFVRRLGGMLPPMMQIMKDIGGVDMPEYFGKLTNDKLDSHPPAEAPTSARSDGKGTPTSGNTGGESVPTAKVAQKEQHHRFEGEPPPESGRI